MRMIQPLLMSFFVFFSSFCLANDDLYVDHTENEKIYISHDQIVLTETGMFILADNSLIPVNQINCDTNGIYISPIMAWTKKKCIKEHEIKCRRCNGCSWRRCEHACWCR